MSLQSSVLEAVTAAGSRSFRQMGRIVSFSLPKENQWLSPTVRAVVRSNRSM